LKRVDTIARVRRAFYVQGWSVKRIVRELHVSRNTVRKILRSDETEFSYERERQPMPRIGPWQEKLDELLLGNANKPSRERLTLIRIYEELRAMGYAGGYDAVRRYARVVVEVPRGDDGGGLRPALLCAGRGLPVRLEP
jgi:transposase